MPISPKCSVAVAMGTFQEQNEQERRRRANVFTGSRYCHIRNKLM